MEEAGQLDGFDLGRSHEAGAVEMFGGDVVATSSNSSAKAAGPRGQRPGRGPAWVFVAGKCPTLCKHSREWAVPLGLLWLHVHGLFLCILPLGVPAPPRVHLGLALPSSPALRFPARRVALPWRTVPQRGSISVSPVSPVCHCPRVILDLLLEVPGST